jgi:hypothetical protein
MSWSSDIRCLYCDGRLPLYRKITSGQFCSTAHRKSYWQEQERLGVERLHETHDSLRAFRPVESVQAILDQKAPEERVPPPSGVIVPSVPPRIDQTPALVAADPFSYESDLTPRVPLWAPQIAADISDDAPAELAGFVEFVSRPQPKWPMDQLEAKPDPLYPTGRVRIPLSPAVPATTDVQTGGAAEISVIPRSYRSEPHVAPISSAMLPTHDIALSVAPQGFPKATDQAEEEIIPTAGKLPLEAFAAREDSSNKSRRDPWPAAPFSGVQRAHLPLAAMNYGLAGGVPPPAGLRPLAIDQVPLVHGTWIDSLRALGAETESPRYELSTPALRPRLRLAAGSRYPVATRDARITVAPIEPEVLPSASGVAIPARSAIAAAVGASSSSDKAAEPMALPIPVPGAAGLLPLAGAVANQPEPPQSIQSVNLPQPLRTEPVRPASRLEPLDAKPVADFMPSAPQPPVEKKVANEQPVQAGALEDLMPPEAKDNVSSSAWTHATGFWKHAPRDLKLLVFGIPILLGLALQPSLKKIPYTAPVPVVGLQKGMGRNFQAKMNDQWVQVRQTMVDRAAIALDEDFRAGLDDWTSRGGTTDWAFDETGFVRPGPLALYRPSLDLSDYQMQFLGMIDKKALSWVVRAADFDDYYVVKLVVLKPGPVPTVGITRYAVVHGVAQNRSDTIAFINAREDTLYRVRMDIHADVFALTIQGQMVDTWSEPRLRKGGVGFFTARGEASRLRWVQVTHQYDMLGRLCAYLAPYNIPSTNGGWQP